MGVSQGFQEKNAKNICSLLSQVCRNFLLLGQWVSSCFLTRTINSCISFRQSKIGSTVYVTIAWIHPCFLKLSLEFTLVLKVILVNKDTKNHLSVLWWCGFGCSWIWEERDFAVNSTGEHSQANSKFLEPQEQKPYLPGFPLLLSHRNCAPD